MKRAVFLDRDGVLIEDCDLLIEPQQCRILPGVPQALARLHERGFVLVVVSNQPVVARGLISESGVEVLHESLAQKLVEAGGPRLARWLFCPHHPHADVPKYRMACECRKPQPGLLFRAARDLELDLAASFLVGDRVSDIVAGARAGCRTVLVRTGRHLAAPIEASEPYDVGIKADFECADLGAAADWVLKVA